MKKLIVLVLFLLFFPMISCTKDNKDLSQEKNSDDEKTEIDNNNDATEDIPVKSIEKGEKDKFDTLIKHLGRTYYKNGSLALDHAGCGFEMRFKGQNLTLDVVSAPVTTLIDVFLDGEYYKSIKIVKNGEIKVLSLDDELEHNVRIIKANSTASGAILINSIKTDGMIIKYDKEYMLKIEFIGDSITVGAGILADNTTPATSYSNSDVRLAYSYVCATLLDAEYSIVATEGICIKAISAVVMNSIDMYQCLSLNNRSKYDFDKEFDIVVVNLGTNDASYLYGHPEYQNDFYADYKELISLVRLKNSNAKIICIYGHMWTNDIIKSSIRLCVKELNDNGDNNVFYFQVTSDMSGAGNHPGEHGGALQGEELYNYIKDNILK